MKYKSKFKPFLIDFLKAPRGVPKIEVQFDLDANGILNVAAKDNSTGRQEKITITNDKGRLSKADIDRMLSDAEKYREEDERQKEKIAARNSLETYIFGCKQAVEDCQSGAISDSDKQIVKDKCASTMSWLDANNLAEKDEFEHKLKGKIVHGFLFAQFGLIPQFFGLFSIRIATSVRTYHGKNARCW